MTLRKANLDDVKWLIELRKKMLIEEGLYVEKNIDNELLQYFENGITKQELMMWVVEEDMTISIFG